MDVKSVDLDKKKTATCSFSLISYRNLALPYTMNVGDKPEIEVSVSFV